MKKIQVHIISFCSKIIICFLMIGITVFVSNLNLIAEWIDISPKSLNLKETIFDISIVDKDTVYAVGWSTGRSVILKTTNGGKDWQIREVAGFYFFSVEAVEKKIFIVGYSARCMCGAFYYSIDNGESWNFYEFDGEKFPLTYGAMKIRKDSNNRYFVTGFNGLIIFSEDDCESWEYAKNDNDTDIFRDIIFINKTDYFAIAGKNSNFSDKIYISKNSGKNWDLYSDFSDEQLSIRGFHFFNSDTGFIFGIGNGQEAIYNTIDGGKNWNQIFQGEVGKTLFDGLFLDSKIGFTAKSSGIILQTTDGGKNWFDLQTPSNYGIKGFRSNNQNGWQNVYAFGDSGTILKFSKTTSVEQNNTEFFLLPNPAEFYIELNSKIFTNYNKAEIYNLLGEKVKTIINFGEKNIINIGNLPSGLYILVLYSTYGDISSVKFQKN